MKLTDRLARDAELLEQRRRRASVGRDDDEEETLTYKEWASVDFLNTAPDVFQSTYQRGINTARSVFDRTAVFQMGQNDSWNRLDRREDGEAKIGR